MIWWHIVLVILISYAFGNVSIARIISSKMNADITKMGSGNPGTTNVLRNFGFKIGLINFILDILKGFIPVLLTIIIFDNMIMTYISGVSVIVGHIYPVVYKFKGGKGIATMLGVFFASNPLATAIVVVVAATCWLLFQYGSMASFICVTVLTVVEGIFAKNNLPLQESRIVCLLLFSIFLLTWFAHRKNIERLLVGKESKVDLIKSVKKKYKQNNK
ncbi:MAG: glycerol-3-phosphate 1-O-acyltransferase PlsY [Clostridia bacterium]|nr:glycerol-3-phosphate 1-O-acyltransferase PlsY [Clostridia bacterium]